MIQETLPARLEAPVPPDSRVSERGHRRSLVDEGVLPPGQGARQQLGDRINLPLA